MEIRPHLVRVDLAAAEIQALEPYEDPVVERLAPESTSSGSAVGSSPRAGAAGHSHLDRDEREDGHFTEIEAR